MENSTVGRQGERTVRGGVSFCGEGAGGWGREGRASVSLKLQGIHLKLGGSWVATFCIFLKIHLGSLGLKNLIAVKMKSCEFIILF